jgi:DNA-binding response OmpR family regulator
VCYKPASFFCKLTVAMRVLIIEDEWMIADDVAAALTTAGCNVAGVAGSIRKALALVNEVQCDVAVLDANLDGASAEPVAKALRQRGVPFLVLSGYASEERCETLADAPFLAKPYSGADLVARVRALGRSAVSDRQGEGA